VIAELIFTALAKLSTRQIAETKQAAGFIENKTSIYSALPNLSLQK